MAFELDAFCRLRPRLYHLTARMNLERILRDRVLHSAERILHSAGAGHLSTDRRGESVVVGVDGARVHVRDQMPLHEGNLAFEDSWGFADLIAHLNRHVFFWPGKQDWAVGSARNYFKRYSNDDCVVLSVDTSALRDANGDTAPLFCAFNSGSPRCHGGLKAPRGARTFVSSRDFERSAAGVVEFVYRDESRLPADGVDVLSVRDAARLGNR